MHISTVTDRINVVKLTSILLSVTGKQTVCVTLTRTGM